MAVHKHAIEGKQESDIKLINERERERDLTCINLISRFLVMIWWISVGIDSSWFMDIGISDHRKGIGN